MHPIELAQHVKRLEITTRHAVTEVLAGEYSSAFKGRGMEFSEVREYQPGDDVRAIDWNVTARAGKPHIKRFVEERELTVMLAVDLSASGAFGTAGDKSKRELSAEIAALLAFAAQRKRDRVGMMLFTDRIESFVPPRKDPRHGLRLVRDLLAFEPRGRGTDLRGAMEHLAKVLKRRAIVFVVSDFLGVDAEEPLSLIRHGRVGHDVVAIDVSDPREDELPRVGLVEVVDPETGRREVIDTSARTVRERYRAAAAARRERLVESLRLAHVDRVAVSTSRPYVHELTEFFKRRERRR